MLRRATFDDAFIIKFNESTPLKLIKTIKPDILMKGSDYKEHEIVGSDLLKKHNGRNKNYTSSKRIARHQILLKKLCKSSN